MNHATKSGLKARAYQNRLIARNKNRVVFHRNPARLSPTSSSSPVSPQNSSAFEEFRDWLIKRMELPEIFFVFLITTLLMVTLYLSIMHPEIM